MKTNANANEGIGVRFDVVRDHLIVRLHRRQYIEEILPTIPYRQVCDMVEAVCFALQNNPEKAFLTVTNGMLKEWGISEEELFRIAVENTVKAKPALMRPLLDIMAEAGLLPDDTEEELQPEHQLYVVTNPDRLLGAGVILYPGFLKKAAKKIGRSFYLIPSSIHEILLLPDTGDVDVDFLKMMINDINRNRVSPEERLSNHPYRYDCDMHCITNEGTEEKAIYFCE